MSGPKRNPDKLNTIGVVVVGICGAVLVYVTIVALQAFYMSDTSELQTMKDYGGQDLTAKGRKADELRYITEAASNGPAGTYRIDIKDAMRLVTEDAKKDPSHLVPALPPAVKPTVEPSYGRPKPLGTAPAVPETGAPGAAPTGAPGQAQPVPGGQPAGATPAPAQPVAPAGGAAAPAGGAQPKAPAGGAAAPAGAQPKAPAGGAAAPAGGVQPKAPAGGAAPPAQPKQPAPAQPKNP